MSQFRPFPLAIAAMFAFATTVVSAQGPVISLFPGDLPKTLTPAELPDDYYAVELESSGGVSPSGVMAALGQASAPGINVSLSTVSWTKGEVRLVGDIRFLVTYRLDDPAEHLTRVMLDEQPASRRTRRPSVLRLTLVRLDGIQTLRPHPEITKAVYLQDLGIGTGTGVVTASPQTVTVNNAKQMALGLLLYSSDTDDLLPYAQSTEAVRYVIHPYVKNTDVFKTLNPAGGQLVFNLKLGGVNMAAIEQLAEAPMIYDQNPWPDGSRVVAFADGHVSVVSRQEWTRKVEPALRRTFPRQVKRPLPLNYGRGLAPSGS